MASLNPVGDSAITTISSAKANHCIVPSLVVWPLDPFEELS